MAGEVSIYSELYPKLLKDIPNPPKKLYFKGSQCTEIFEHCVAVVGSRNMSVYGRKVIDELFSVLSKKITIVSGFMFGVDAEAHQKALQYGLKTIAVMPCGIDRIHPEDQEDLYHKIEENGLILSEYQDDFEPKVWTYPRRNRIVAGLSIMVVVVEASIKSGSLITARLSHSFGRKVCVVPGSIFSNLSAGKVQISNEFANNIDSGFFINKYLSLSTVIDNQKDPIDCREDTILNLIKSDPMTVNELSKYTSKSISDLSIQLTHLSLDGYVIERGGKFYAC